jgi:RecB family exonuclease
LAPSVELLRSRRGRAFSPYDGNLASLAEIAARATGPTISPTALETYASCGFRYFLGSVLRLRGVEEPEEGDTIGAAERGTLVHATLERFFREQQARGRPQPGERWSLAGDLPGLLAILDQELEKLQAQGRTGLDIYLDYDRQSLRADLALFLEADSDFRERTGAVPTAFEHRLQPQALGEISLTGFVDRIDITKDGRHAYVIDYKTGSASEYAKADAGDPFVGGTKLQLPVYTLAASEAESVQALYWFISRRGGFEQISYDESPATRARFEATVRAVLDGMHTGAFPAVPGDDDEFHGGYTNCRYCDFDRICSRRRMVEHQEKHADPALHPWLRVAFVARGEA